MSIHLFSLARTGNTIQAHWSTNTPLATSGIIWDKHTNPITNSTCSANRTVADVICKFTSTCSGSTYVRAWNTYDGTSNELNIAMNSCFPSLTTTTITNIIGSTATSGGGTITNAGTPVTAKGVCWNTSTNPTIANNHTLNGTGNTSFSSSITGLTEGKLYYVRAYATNSYGTSYGNQLTFTSYIYPPSLTGGTDVHLFPNLGWSGKTQVSTWTGCTQQKWYGKLSTAGSYSLLATLGKATGNTYQHYTLKPNLNYNFYTIFSGATGVSANSNIITINNNVSAPTATYSSIIMI
jgi:hypothetical protein